MDIKQKILYYLDLCDGRAESIKKRIEQDIICNFQTKERKKYLDSIDCAFRQLQMENKIRCVPYSKMNANQRKVHLEEATDIYEKVTE